MSGVHISSLTLIQQSLAKRSFANRGFQFISSFSIGGILFCVYVVFNLCTNAKISVAWKEFTLS
jgi:hypothetical protein